LAHTPEELKAIVEKEDLHWRSFADDGSINRTWNSPPTPGFFVIDHLGTIRHKWMGHPGEKVIDDSVENLIDTIR
jgi:hypothetical protein